MLILLREEMQHADAYLYIMSMRFGSRLEIRKEIDTDILIDGSAAHFPAASRKRHRPRPGAGGARGAVVHGGAGGEYGLRVSIRNSGHEINEAEVTRVNRMLEDSSGSGGRLGMANISERLRLIYGSTAGLRLKNSRMEPHRLKYLFRIYE